MKKFISIALVAVLALVGFILFASPAQATQPLKPVKFKPYSTTQTWYAPTPASVSSPFAVPQTTTVLECGGIKQVDKYRIDTAELDLKYKALIAGGVLNSPADDAPFHPQGVVTALPDCVPVVVVPEKPEPIVETVSVKGPVDCITKTFVVTTTVTTTDWVYNEETNAWDKTEPVSVPTDETFEASAEDCPVVVPPTTPTDPEVPPTTPTDPEVPPTTPETPTEPEEPVVTPEVPVTTPETPAITPVTPVDAPVVSVKPAVQPTKFVAAEKRVAAPVQTDALAYTGTNENFVSYIILAAGMAILAGVALLAARLKRGRVEAGVIE